MSASQCNQIQGVSNGQACAFTRENRVMIKDLVDSRDLIRGDIKGLSDKVDKAINRPGWVVTLIISGLSSACVGFLVFGLRQMAI